MARQTIGDIAADILKVAGRPMSAQEVYDAIAAKKLYEFNAKSPLGIVRSALSKHSIQNTHSCASTRKIFSKVEGGRFELISSADSTTPD